MYSKAIRTVAALAALALLPLPLGPGGSGPATVCANVADDCFSEPGSLCETNGTVTLDHVQKRS